MDTVFYLKRFANVIHLFGSSNLMSDCRLSLWPLESNCVGSNSNTFSYCLY